jgi:hypothetical protein
VVCGLGIAGAVTMSSYHGHHTNGWYVTPKPGWVIPVSILIGLVGLAGGVAILVDNMTKGARSL